jgi:hypothetical protein
VIWCGAVDCDMSGFLFKFKNLPHATKNSPPAQLQSLESAAAKFRKCSCKV